MPGLSEPARLLCAWEHASAVPPTARGAVLVWHGGYAEGLQPALRLPVGELSARAGRLYAEEFGDRIEALLPCGDCGGVLDVTLPLDALRAGTPDTEGRVPAPGGGEFTVRALTTGDLLAAGRAADPAAELLVRCVTDPAGGSVDPSGLPPELLARVETVAEHLAGAAGAMVRTACPTCGRETSAPLDLAALLWDRVAAEAPALLTEVATLAAAFAWREADILELSPARRAAYLRLARGGAP
ncbi:hypothetical protein ACFWIN_00470 [Streptomyces sp. NPDC127049]|uniref:hypothetical protein n=1 Tax=Streptomyces sp. NPDC127049 TaxID=3347118 RepID=UPI00364B44DE